MADTSLQIGNRTSPGKVREENQDYLGYYRTPLGDLFVVCDGMGGPSGGQTASRLAVDQISLVFQASDGNADVRETILKAFRQANRAVFEASQQDVDLKGMGTTCVLALVQNGVAHVAHVGDSRVYLVRQGVAVALTKDHSLVQQMIDKGGMTESEALDHPDRNIITRAIGIKGEVEAEVLPEPMSLHNGDHVLLTTDGLTNYLSDTETASITTYAESAQTACTDLVNLANERGGTDNITVQVVRVEQSPPVSSRRRYYVALSSVVIGIALIAGCLLAYTYYTGDSNSGSAATLAIQEGRFEEGYSLLRELIDQRPDDEDALDKMMNLADSTLATGLDLYSDRKFDEAHASFDIAQRAYTDIADNDLADQASRQTEKAKLMANASLLHRDKHWTRNGAISVYERVLQLDAEDTLATNSLVSIGDQLEIEGQKHEAGEDFGKAKGRYVAALEVWKVLSAIPKDFATRIEKSTRMIAACDRKLEAPKSGPETGTDSASKKPAESIGLSTNPAKPEQVQVSKPTTQLVGQSAGEVSPVNAKSKLDSPEETTSEVKANPSTKSISLNAQIINPEPDPIAKLEAETTPDNPAPEELSPVIETGVIQATMRNAAGLDPARYLRIQSGAIRKLRTGLVILKPDQTLHTHEHQSAIIYRKIQGDTSNTAQNRMRADRVKHLGVSESVWSPEIRIKPWGISPESNAKDKEVILIIVGTDHDVIFSPEPSKNRADK